MPPYRPRRRNGHRQANWSSLRRCFKLMFDAKTVFDGFNFNEDIAVNGCDEDLVFGIGTGSLMDLDMERRGEWVDILVKPEC
ncbi:hypothetical protein L195_g044908 [Trifolium pratense]|uniref:Uncharacterized protein n=1 Tax=Trifolium pratense TaxID=57577 RepID=A0A2K3MDC1_TRIPR|nr:hypothetical protein L195_g044908 [Trifolium pratense]